MIPTTTKELAKRLADAFSVIARMPEGDRPRGYKTSWPDYAHAAIEAYGYDDAKFSDARTSEARPRPDEIDPAIEVMGWFVLLPLPDQNKLLLAHAAGRRFRSMRGWWDGNRQVGPRWQFRADWPARTYTEGHLRDKHRQALGQLLRILRNGAR